MVKEFAMTFDEIYNLYAKKVLNSAYRLTGNEELAKEMLSYEQQQHFFRSLMQIEMGRSKGLYPESPSERRSNSKSKRNHIQENEERKK